MTRLAVGFIISALALGTALISTSLAQIGPPIAREAGTDTITLPASVPDPLEPFNRLVYGFNKVLMTDAVMPTTRIYRSIVIKPARIGIANFGKNITYPGRLFNNLLQGKWTGARDETYRFGCNMTAGIGGLLDVATKWKIPKWEADFGQTFGQWGWKPGCYLML